MKARFSQPQLPVSVVRSDGKVYIFICLNEQQGTDSYPDMEGGQTEETYCEYDYTEISGPEGEIPVDDIQSHPENYLDYEYDPEPDNPGGKALKEIEELKTAIERGLTL